MSFEDKKIKVSAFQIDGKFDIEKAEMMDLLRAKAAIRLDHLAKENGAENIGWSAGKDELDNELKEENCVVGEYFYLTMRIAKRKISASIAKAMLRKKINEYMRAHDIAFVNRKVRGELKHEVESQLVQNTMPSLRSIWVIICPNGKLYAGTSSNREIELLYSLFYKTFSAEIIPQISFFNDDNIYAKSDFPELEFMTDLFRRSEVSGVTFMIETPFAFIALDDESPCVSTSAAGAGVARSNEVRTALREGKLLAKVKLLVCGDACPGYRTGDYWNFTLTRNFALTSLALPEGEEMDINGCFIERIDMLDAIFTWLLEQKNLFIERISAGDYQESKSEWIHNR